MHMSALTFWMWVWRHKLAYQEQVNGCTPQCSGIMPGTVGGITYQSNSLVFCMHAAGIKVKAAEFTSVWLLGGCC